MFLVRFGKLGVSYCLLHMPEGYRATAEHRVSRPAEIEGRTRRCIVGYVEHTRDIFRDWMEVVQCLTRVAQAVAR